MIPYYTNESTQIFCADNVIFANTILTDSVSLTVSSPPYDALRDYTSEVSWNFEKFKCLATELYRITKPGGVVVWNVADQTINGSETGSSFRQALYFMECGFNLADTMIYKKANPGGARGSNKTYIQCFEYMFVLSKGAIKTHNLIW
jgi:DNA modification methylase